MLTRAKRALVVFGNQETLAGSNSSAGWPNWIDWIREKNAVVTLDEALSAQPAPPAEPVSTSASSVFNDWKEVHSATHGVYYFNEVTSETSWDHPCEGAKLETIQAQ